MRRGKQVMVFVHSRKDTAKTARALRDLAMAEGCARLLSPFGGSSEEGGAEAGAAPAADGSGGEAAGAPGAAAPSRRPPGAAQVPGAAAATPAIQGEGRVHLSMPQWVAMQREVDKSRNAELRELFPSGFGECS